MNGAGERTVGDVEWLQVYPGRTIMMRTLETALEAIDTM